MRNIRSIGVIIMLPSVSGFQPKPLPGRISTRLLDKPPIHVVEQPDSGFLASKGVFDWPTWGCDVGSFPWSYGESESCYVLTGKVTVTPTDGRPSVTFVKGDFVTFPAGMSCQWDVKEAVQKHYTFF
jgi:uncharacterized protein